MRIDNHIALLSARGIAETSKAIQNSLVRLSTNQRITRPQDDIASYSTLVGIDSQVRALRQANLNINQGAGLVQTAQASISTQIDLLQRMRELAVMGSNTTLTSGQRSGINQELQELRNQFDDLSRNTEFNGMKLFDGSQSTIQLMIGAHASDKIELALPNLSASKLFRRDVGTGVFQSSRTVSTGSLTAPSVVKAGDIDNDGDMDLVTRSLAGFALGAALNDGEGNFSAVLTSSSSSFLVDFDLVDINGDGNLDILGSQLGDLAIFTGNGDGSFNDIQTLDPNFNAADVVTGDFNGDGILDIATNENQSDAVSIFLGLGAGNFAAATSVVGLSDTDSLVVGDMNGDGLDDLVAMAYTNAQVQTLISNGDGSFSAASVYNADYDIVEGAIGDFNQDGILDFVGVDYTTASIEILLGVGDGSFAAGSTIAVSGTNTGEVQIGDLNGDSILDIVTIDSSYTRSLIYLSDGIGSYSLSQSISHSAGQLDLADLNGDGAKEIITFDNTLDFLIFENATESRSAVSEINVDTSENAHAVLEILDSAIGNLELENSKLAAVYSRLDTASAYNLLISESLEEARDRIGSPDLALETAELLKSQILQNAQIAVLTQANVESQRVLELLKNLKSNR